MGKKISTGFGVTLILLAFGGAVSLITNQLSFVR